MIIKRVAKIVRWKTLRYLYIRLGSLILVWQLISKKESTDIYIYKSLVGQWLSWEEKDMANRDQIGKGMNVTIPLHAMGK